MKKIFSKMFGWMINEQEISHDWKKILGIIFAIAAIVFGCLWYKNSSVGTVLKAMTWPLPTKWVDHNFSTKLSFQFPPDPLNVLWGLALCFPIYLRDFIPFKKLSPYTYISFLFNWTLFSVFTQLFFGISGTFSYNIMQTALIGSLLVSWIGIRSIAGFGWIIVFLFAFINLIRGDYHLKHFGILFMMSAFSSLLFQTSLTPKNFFNKIWLEFKGLDNDTTNFVRESMAEAGRATKNMAGAAIKVATKT